MMVLLIKHLNERMAMGSLATIRHDFAELSDLLVALGDDKRQDIIVAMLADGACRGLRVNDLMGATGLSRPAVSHHIKVLRQAGLVECHSEGTKNYYSLTHKLDNLERLRELVDDIERLIREKQR